MSKWVREHKKTIGWIIILIGIAIIYNKEMW